MTSNIPVKKSSSIKKRRRKTYRKLRPEDWRYGPARLWYDMLGVPTNGEGFDYGFKLSNVSQFSDNECTNKFNIPDESFLMVAQTTWEDDVIWDDNDVCQRVMENLNEKTKTAGWLPTSVSPIAPILSQPNKETLTSFDNPVQLYIETKQNSRNKNGGSDSDSSAWYSVFNIENQDLIHKAWEDEIIWDPEAVARIPGPKIPTYDPNDENIIFNIPDEDYPKQQENDTRICSGGNSEGKKSSSKPLDPFNISNDRYYFPETTSKSQMVDGTILHSVPVLELRAPFVPNRINPSYLRNFHRPKLKRYSHGKLALPGPHHITSLVENIKEKARLRELDRNAFGSDSLLRTGDEMTGRDGELILIEFCEQYPPLMSQVGMCSKIKNYFDRKKTENELPSHFRYGDVADIDKMSYFGTAQKEPVQVIENNMYRAPIYRHKISETDFLVLRSRHEYCIREFDSLFVAGQQCPFYVVPKPHSLEARNFVKKFMQAFIYRLFWRSEFSPKRIKMKDILKAFPAVSRQRIYKLVHLCATYTAGWWILKPRFRLPSEEEIRAMVSAEECCAYLSMMAAQQRLEDVGVQQPYLAFSNDEDENYRKKVEDELKAAPWNTTAAFQLAMKGISLLDLSGPADPTGCGEGFSFTSLPKSQIRSKKEKKKMPSTKTAPIPKFDVEKVSPKNAKILLHKFGIPKREINELNQWEVLGALRILSKKKSKFIERMKAKFAAETSAVIENSEKKFQKEWERIFLLEKRKLSSHEMVLTDPEDSSDAESGLEEMGKLVEKRLMDEALEKQLFLQQEERRRKELKKMIHDNEKYPDCFSDGKKNRILKIYRTFRDFKGRLYTRTEVVRRPDVITEYVRAKIKELEFKKTETGSRGINENNKKIPLNSEPTVKKATTSSTNIDFTQKSINVESKQVTEDVEDFAVVDGTKIKIRGKLKKTNGALKRSLEKNENAVATTSVNVDSVITDVVARQVTNENAGSVTIIDGTKIIIKGKFGKHNEEIEVEKPEKTNAISSTSTSLTQPFRSVPLKHIIADVEDVKNVDNTEIQIKDKLKNVSKHESSIAACSEMIDITQATNSVISKQVVKKMNDVTIIDNTKIDIRNAFKKHNRAIKPQQDTPIAPLVTADLTQPISNVISEHVSENVDDITIVDRKRTEMREEFEKHCSRMKRLRLSLQHCRSTVAASSAVIDLTQSTSNEISEQVVEDVENITVVGSTKIERNGGIKHPSLEEVKSTAIAPSVPTDLTQPTLTATLEPVIEQAKNDTVVDGAKVKIRNKMKKRKKRIRVKRPYAILKERENTILKPAISTDVNQSSHSVSSERVSKDDLRKDAKNIGIVDGTKSKLQKRLYSSVDSREISMVATSAINVVPEPCVKLPKLVVKDVDKFVIVDDRIIKIRGLYPKDNRYSPSLVLRTNIDSSQAPCDVKQKIIEDAENFGPKCISSDEDEYTGKPRQYFLRSKESPKMRGSDLTTVLYTVLKSSLEEISLTNTLPYMDIKKRYDCEDTTTKSMDLRNVREIIFQRRYQKKKEFLADVNQIYQNCISYYGTRDTKTLVAKMLFDSCYRRLEDKKLCLKKLEIVLNPLSAETLKHFRSPDSLLQKGKKTKVNENTNEFFKNSLQQILTEELLYSSEDDDCEY